VAIAVKQNLVAKSKYGIKAPFPMEAEYITFHNTANDATAEGEIKYMIGNNSEVSYHFAVDEDSVVQGVPTNRSAWHCGDGRNGTGNRKSIGVEVCYSKSGGEKYKKAEALAIKFIAQLLHERKWGVDRVKPHKVWSGKYCPHRVFDQNRWNAVIAEIQAELNALQGKKPVASTPAPAPVKGYVKKGNEGEKVKELQTLLNKVGYNVGKADGIFGAKTDEQVRYFQRDHKLAVDGIAGNATFQALDAVSDAIDAKAKAQAEAKAKAEAEAKRKAEEAKKPTVVTTAPANDVYGTIKVLASNLNVREKADFNSKIVKVVQKGESYKVYAQKNGLYHLGGNQYVTANAKYVQFTKNPNFGKAKLLEVTVGELFTYKTANWNDKGEIVKKGEVFTISKELTVDGSKMYQLKSGVFITANPKYIKIR
jgi:peptidoglycan hydrolase-like protein with peptidoglycan-binding domain